MYVKIRQRLEDYYINKLPNIAKGVSERVFARMDECDRENPEQSSYQLKSKLYDTIADEITPTFF